MNSLPNGVFAASLTPLKGDLSINYSKLIAHSTNLLQKGCDGVVLMGTTGEANSFDSNERKKILEETVKSGVAPHRILVGTGCCSLTETVTLTKHALDNGVNHVLVLPPFYYRAVDDNGLFSYFEELISRVNNPTLRIYLYHFPKMTGLPFSHSLIGKLLKSFPGIIEGIKDSTGDWNNTSGLLDQFPGFRIFSGTETFLLDVLKKGGAGTISASVNVTYRQTSAVYKNFNNADGEIFQEKATTIRRAIEKYPTIPVLKLILSQLENDEEWLNIRPPLTPLALWNEDELKSIINCINA